MRDTELYQHLLGLVAPWEVSRVELSVADGRVDVWAQHPRRTRFACPECERELAVYDHSEERAWRHLDSCGFLTYLHADPPRVDCPDHGGPPAPPAVGGAELKVHHVVRAAGDRRAQRVRRDRRGPAAAPELG